MKMHLFVLWKIKDYTRNADSKVDGVRRIPARDSLDSLALLTHALGDVVPNPKQEMRETQPFL